MRWSRRGVQQVAWGWEAVHGWESVEEHTHNGSAVNVNIVVISRLSRLNRTNVWFSGSRFYRNAFGNQMNLEIDV